MSDAATHDLVAELAATGAALDTSRAICNTAARDWWPLGLIEAAAGVDPQPPVVVCRPADADQVAAVAAVCNELRVPLTAAGGRSGVLGGAVPLHGGVALDLRSLTGIRSIDHESLVVDVGAGTFGHDFENALAHHALTVGHWPQSMELSTVGGWLACRGAGQFSGRYGKIEDIVEGLDVVLADGRRITTGGFPRSATGPDLTQVFVGSEGTLGIITGARLRAHPRPTATACGAWAFPSFTAGLEALRDVVQHGAHPAVLRLYDAAESARSHGVTDGSCVLLAYDEADEEFVALNLDRVRRAAMAAGASRLGDELVDHWFEHRNDVAALHTLIGKGYVIDTMELSASWATLPALCDAVTGAIQAVPGALSASAHQSHSYSSGGCLYVTFAGRPDQPDAATDRDGLDQRRALHQAMWRAGQDAALAAGASLSHHHGVGLARGPDLPRALGTAFDVLVSLKAALDPHEILNPGKLGLPTPPWMGAPGLAENRADT
jgi:alkyldihydroxyacetonephosphate synthase